MNSPEIKDRAVWVLALPFIILLLAIATLLIWKQAGFGYFVTGAVLFATVHLFQYWTHNSFKRTYFLVFLLYVLLGCLCWAINGWNWEWLVAGIFLYCAFWGDRLMDSPKPGVAVSYEETHSTHH